MGERKELPIPPSSMQSERAFEILRVWINSDKSMDAVLDVAFYETGYWGVLLADLTDHIAKAYARVQTDVTEDEVRESIRSVYINGFDARQKVTQAAQNPAPNKKK